MHTFDLNLDWVDEEEEEEVRRPSAEALGSSDEELNGFIDYFLHGSDSVVSQSNQSRRRPEESISRSRVIISRNEGMDLDFVELGLGLGLDSDTNNEAPFDLNVVSVNDLEMFELLSEEAVQDVEDESGESSFSWMGEMELVCEEDFRVLVNDSNTNNEALELLSEVFRDLENESNIYNAIQFDYNDDAMMVDPPEEGIGMIINAADDDDYIYTSWSMQTVTCDVDNLPSVTLTQEELNKNNSICAICMENFCIEEKLKRLPCFHYYHVDCISPWLRTRNSCPTCRYELPII